MAWAGGMLNERLRTFMCVCERGSFTKAASVLYISPNAVLKQIRQLEADIGAVLFERSSQGVTPTAAGRALLQGVSQLLKDAGTLSKDIMRKGGAKTTIRLGTSLMRSSAMVGALWARVSTEHPTLALEIRSIPDDVRGWNDALEVLGVGVDVVCAIEPSHGWPWYGHCDVRELCRTPLSCAVPVSSPLAVKESLTLDDLRDQRILIPERGAAPGFDSLRDHLEDACPQAEIVDTPPYDLAYVNRAASDGMLVASTPEIATAHPSFVNKSVDWGAPLTVAYCLITPAHPSDGVREFIDAVLAEAGRQAT